MAAVHVSPLKRAIALLVLALPALAVLGVVGPSSPAKAATDGKGYWEVASDGGIFGFGDARFQGSTGGTTLNAPIVGMAAHPSGDGYWFVASDGGVFAFGAAKFFGSMGGSPLNAPIVGMAAHPSGNGYWLVADDGGIFSFGASRFFGSMGGRPLNAPIVGMAAHPSGAGYWFVAADGGIFSFGASTFFGSMGGRPLNAPIVGMAAHPSGAGYWFVAADGGIFSFGASTFFGSMGGRPLNAPIVGMATAPLGNGYWFVASDGGIFSFGGSRFHGSMGGSRLNAPIVGMAATPDSMKPAVTVTQAAGQEDPTDEAAVDFTVTFSEPVSGFTGSDVTIGGTAGATTATVTGSGTTYNVAVSGMTGNGTVTVQVLDGKAADSVGNPNTASNVKTLTVDRIGPAATVAPAQTQEQPSTDEPTVDFTVTFTEPVTGFAKDDVALSGTSGANDVTVSGSGTTYNVAVTGMSQDGTVTVTVPAGAAADVAGNPNTGPAGASITYDNTDPTPTVAVPSSQEDPTDESAIDFTVTFDEAVSESDFDDAGDVVVTGTPGGTATIGNAGDSDPATYTVSVTGMTGTGGSVTVTVPAGAAADGAGNPSRASAPVSVLYDNLDPTFDSISATGGSPTVVATFSEPVLCSTVQAADFGASGGRAVTAVGCTAPTDATIELTLDSAPAGGTTIQVTYAANPTPITDEAGNEAASATRSTTASSSFTVEVEKAAGQGDPTNDPGIDFTVTFSAPVAANSFQSGDVTVSGTATYGTQQVTLTSSDQRVFNVAVSGMTTNTTGTVTISVGAGKVQDADGNLNAASTPDGDVEITYDSMRPTVTVAPAETQEDPTDEDTVDFTVVFSEPVQLFSANDIDLSGTADEEAEALADITEGPTTYKVAVDATGDGTVELRVVAGGDAKDAAGNLIQSSASTPASVTLDNTAPRVTIDEAVGQNDPSSDSAIDFKVTFTEPVFGLVAEDFTLSGTANPTTAELTATGSPLVYTVSVTGMTQDGDVTLALPAGRAVDEAGNPNTASTTAAADDDTVTRETVRPVPTITRSGPQFSNASTFTFTVTFTEAVTGFDEADVTVTAPGNETYDVSDTQGTTYTVTVQTTTDGLISVEVKAGGAVDAAGNTNTGPVSASVTRDTIGPTVTVSQHADQTENPTDEAQIEFAVVFAEAVTGFDHADVTVAGTANPTAPAAGSVTGSGTDYRVVVSGMAPGTVGTVTLSVKVGGAVDNAGNGNAASTTPGTVDYDDKVPVFEAVSANAGSNKVLAEFDEPLDCTSVTTGDFTAEVNGVPVVVTGVACSGSSDDVLELTLSSAPTAGQSVDVTLKATNGGVADRAGNPTTSQVTRSTTAQPLSVTVARVGPQATNADDVQFVVTFSEAVTGFAAEDVTVTPAGSYTVTVSPTTGPEDVYTVTLESLTDGTFTVSVPAGKAQDADGTSNAASNSVSVTRDTVAPTFSSISATGGNDDVTVTFSGPVDCGTVAAGDFTVEFTPGDVAAAVTSVSGCTSPEDNEFTLTLDKVAPPGVTVEVTLSGQIKDLIGNVVAGATRTAQALA